MIILTKESFWLEMDAKYPATMLDFKKWVDEYKAETNWTRLFNIGEVLNYGLLGRHDVKFHDLPVEFQIGVLIRFFYERGLLEYRIGEDITNDIASNFELLESAKTH